VYLRVLSALGLLGASVVLVAASPSTAQAAPATCHGERATIVGTERADDLTGTPHRDVIASLGGADDIRGGGGDDLICAGRGDDDVRNSGWAFIEGGPGDDKLVAPGAVFLGGPGDDVMRAGDVSSQFRGGPGADTMIGGDADMDVGDKRGPSIVRLGDGDGDGDLFAGEYDNLIGVWGDSSVVSTGAGVDQIYAPGNDAVIHAGGGDDELDVLAGVVSGGSGRDVFQPLDCDACDPAAQLDLRAGQGDDLLWFRSVDTAAVTNLEGGVGTDTLRIDAVSDTKPDPSVVEVSLGSEMLQPWNATVTGFEEYRGTSGVHLVTGTDGPNVIRLVGTTDSEMRGLAGDDHLEGGAYADGGDDVDECIADIVVHCE
jgi:hypothetical protein